MRNEAWWALDRLMGDLWRHAPWIDEVDDHYATSVAPIWVEWVFDPAGDWRVS